MSEEQKPKKKPPKKSKRQKRRYLLFQLKPGSCRTGKQAFDLIMGQFSMSERKALSIWFIEFKPSQSKGIVRCRLGSEQQVKKAIAALPPDFEAKTLRTSGTLKALRF